MSIDSQDFLVDSFLTFLEIEKGGSSNTVKGYNHDLGLLKEFLIERILKGDEDKFGWEKFSILHIRAFLKFLYTERSNRPSSIHRRVCSIKAFYKYLHDNQMIEKDIAADLKYPKRPSSIPKFLEKDHILTLIAETTNLTHRAIIEVLYSTGARVNEIRSLNIEDINLKERVIIIRSGKGNKDRIVLLTERATNILRDYLNTKRPNILTSAANRKSIPTDSAEAVFLSNRGTRIANRTIQHFISKLSETAGIKHTTPHMLRHSFASHLVMNNANIRVVQQLLGHASLDTTQIYANITPDFLKKEFDDSLPIR